MLKVLRTRNNKRKEDASQILQRHNLHTAITYILSNHTRNEFLKNGTTVHMMTPQSSLFLYRY
jgi:hypothetical protein